LTIGDPGASGTRNTLAPPVSVVEANAAAARSITRASRALPDRSDIAAAYRRCALLDQDAMRRSAVTRFGPPLLLMAVIFFLSAQPNLGTGLGVWDTILRKGAHMAEFGLLFVLWWRAFGYRRRAAAVVIALTYAASDELHQHFVAGRHASPVDWLIDAAGVVIAVALTRRLSAAPPVK
jgi:VanZ family protein